MDSFFEEVQLPRDLVEYIDNNGIKWIGRSICVKFKPKYYGKLKKLLPEIRKEYKVKGFSRVQMCGSDVDDEILLIFYKD